MHRLCAFLFLTFSAIAQEPTVRLSTMDGKTQFRIGQPITVTLTFESTGAMKHSVLTAVPPRRIRPQIPDQFTAEPVTRWVDPLKDLQWTMESGANSALPQSEAVLDASHPVAVERNLNEFIVFHTPGHYVVHCSSSRVMSGNGAKVESNGLALDILPRDAAEDARQFAAARTTLESGKPPKEPERFMRMDKENAQAAAIRTLRHLDTEPAAIYMASIYGEGRRTQPDIEYALYASEHREAIVRELERRLADPDLTVTQTYLITLTQLKGRLEEGRIGHKLSTAEWNVLDESVNRRVFELAAAKTPQARADTYYYLFETGSTYYQHSPEMRRLLVESLPFLSPFSIEILLCNNWAEIRDAKPQVLPFLKEAVSRQWPQINPSIPGLALLRLAEFDATAANPTFARELGGCANCPLRQPGYKGPALARLRRKTRRAGRAGMFHTAAGLFLSRGSTNGRQTCRAKQKGRSVPIHGVAIPGPGTSSHEPRTGAAVDGGYQELRSEYSLRRPSSAEHGGIARGVCNVDSGTGSARRVKTGDRHGGSSRPKLVFERRRLYPVGKKLRGPIYLPGNRSPPAGIRAAVCLAAERFCRAPGSLAFQSRSGQLSGAR
jgi:hypothetical protein